MRLLEQTFAHEPRPREGTSQLTQYALRSVATEGSGRSAVPQQRGAIRLQRPFRSQNGRDLNSEGEEEIA